jgi:hypothetical protein
MVLPNDAKSTIDSELPSLVIPNMLSDEPSLANARSETQLPIWMKSRKLIEDPSLDIP